MIRIEKICVMNFENALRGARNPLNSWAKSDSYVTEQGVFHLGEADLALCRRLCAAGSDERKFMRQIFVSLDITAPLYCWKEFDTYKVGTVANSCSTMHKIAAKEFTLDDFSCEHLLEEKDVNVPDDSCCSWNWEGCGIIAPINILEETVNMLNTARKMFLETKDKKYWWQMIQLLPSSYNQRRTVMLNYEVLANIYKSRKNHKLDEWHTFCDWIEGLPYSELITGEKK